MGVRGASDSRCFDTAYKGIQNYADGQQERCSNDMDPSTNPSARIC